ncbi:MAG: prephenate dehydratase [Gemmatimonadetes bacterium]|nr:prephenate dehydratase [Gemmatimonadota bacterium]
MATIVAFQGETGAFSEVAARQFVAEPVTLLPCATFDAAVRAVVNGHADCAAIPIFNLIAGPVHEAVDAIAAFPSLERVGELKLPIHLALMGVEGTTLDGVREVLSHGIALQQCTRFFAEHPQIVGVEAHDTAGAARMVAIRRDPSAAALAATWAATVYGLTIIAERLEDRADNVTTFVLVRRIRRDVANVPSRFAP